MEYLTVQYVHLLIFGALIASSSWRNTAFIIVIAAFTQIQTADFTQALIDGGYGWKVYLVDAFIDCVAGILAFSAGRKFKPGLFQASIFSAFVLLHLLTSGEHYLRNNNVMGSRVMYDVYLQSALILNLLAVAGGLIGLRGIIGDIRDSIHRRGVWGFFRNIVFELTEYTQHNKGLG